MADGGAAAMQAVNGAVWRPRPLTGTWQQRARAALTRGLGPAYGGCVLQSSVAAE